MQYIKPENVLKRAEELIEINKKQDALEALHNVLIQKRVRSLWSATIEQIMIRYLDLCTDLRNMRMVREGLHLYRNMCQNANIGSLEMIVQQFRKNAETKVNAAMKSKADSDTARMEDFDEAESPEVILLRAIQAGDTRQQSQDGDAHMHFRFLWDAYKVILDVLKGNARLEEVYHEVARSAFDFCRVHERPLEFKRFGDSLRRHMNDIATKKSTSQNSVNLSAPETMARMLETKCRQVQTSIELNLWREAYQIATDMHELMSKGKPKAAVRSQYYEFLGRIFWKSETYVFHAFACLKNLQFVKSAKRDLPAEELEFLASKALLASLCAPFASSESDMSSTLELTTEVSTSPHEKAKKHAALFSAQSVPNRDVIVNQLVEKNLVNYAVEPCKKLFLLLESDFTPLSLCQDAKPYLDILEEGSNVCNGKLKEYVEPLKKIIFLRLLKQLSEVYASMTIQNFEQAASIVPFSIAETWMVNFARNQGINIQINYNQNAILFGATQKVDMRSMRQPLIEIGSKLRQAIDRVVSDDQVRKERQERSLRSKTIADRIEVETTFVRQRKEEIERRKQESERIRAKAEQEAMDQQRKLEERERDVERQRQEVERRRREQERADKKKAEAEKNKNIEMLTQMKKQAEEGSVNLKVAGKRIADIGADDLDKINFNDIEKARDVQLQRVRQEKIRQRKLESKRVDHLARALREEQFSLLADWSHEVVEEDEKVLEQIEEVKSNEQRLIHEQKLNERDAVAKYLDAVNDWTEEQLYDRRTAWEEKCAERNKRLTEIAVANKIQRAKKRYDQYMEELREEEEARLAEEARIAEEERFAAEEKARKEEEERKAAARKEEEDRRAAARKEEEERRAAARKEEDERREIERKEQDANRARLDQMRQQREREIEERQERERKEKEEQEKNNRSNHNSFGGRDKKDDDIGSWRNAAPRRSDNQAAPAQGGSWRDRENRRAEDSAHPRFTNSGRTSNANSNGLQRSENAWRSGGMNRNADREAPPREEPERKEPVRERQAAPAPWRRDTATSAASAPARAEPAPAPASAPEPAPRRAAPLEERHVQAEVTPAADDDGFEMVVSNNRKKKNVQKEAPTPTGESENRMPMGRMTSGGASRTGAWKRP